MSEEAITLMERNDIYIPVSHPLCRSNSLIENATVAYPTRIKTIKTLNYEFEHLAKGLFSKLEWYGQGDKISCSYHRIGEMPQFSLFITVPPAPTRTRFESYSLSAFKIQVNRSRSHRLNLFKV